MWLWIPVPVSVKSGVGVTEAWEEGLPCTCADLLGYLGPFLSGYEIWGEVFDAELPPSTQMGPRIKHTFYKCGTRGTKVADELQQIKAVILHSLTRPNWTL